MDAEPVDVKALVEKAFRDDQGRAVGSLLRSFGDLTLAEESVQEAFALALTHWALDPPRNPGGWILTTARNRAIDKLRRGGRLEQKTAEMAVELDRRQQARDDSPFSQTIIDDRLRLIFICCHPSLDTQAQVGLTLRLVAGLTTPQIASALLVTRVAMAARLTRAKARIKATGMAFCVPDDHELPQRLPPVLRVVYLLFNQGYVQRDGDRLMDVRLTGEAIRLGRLLHRLMPDEPEVTGLLALMVLIDSRRQTRTRGSDVSGARLVLLQNQDRSRWDGNAIQEGASLVQEALRQGRPGPYQLQAAIQAVHAGALAYDETDWSQIAGLYATLQVMDPSPVVALNAAVAHGMADGPAAGLSLIDRLEPQLSSYHLFHAARAQFLKSLGHTEAARGAFNTARQLTDNAVEQRFLDDQVQALP